MICKICSSSSRTQVDRALLGGKSVRKIGSQFNFSPSAVWRHATNCLRREEEEREIQARAPRRGFYKRGGGVCNCPNPVLRVEWEDAPIKNWAACWPQVQEWLKKSGAIAARAFVIEWLETFVDSFEGKKNERAALACARAVLALKGVEPSAELEAAMSEAEAELSSEEPPADAGREGGLHGLA